MTQPVQAGGGHLVPGVDVVDVAEVAASIDRFGERYLARMFSADELSVSQPMAPARRRDWLAGRVAAKEAVYKSLRMPGGLGLAWSSISIVPGDDGAPVVHLDGPARQWARGQRVDEVRVSVSQAGGTALAMALAHHGSPPAMFGHEGKAADTPPAAPHHDHGADHDGPVPHTDRPSRSTP